MSTASNVHEEVIKEAMLIEWGIETLRPFQFEGTRYLTDRGEEPRCLLVDVGTGGGKTAIMHGAATLLCGITLIMIPLQSLASDQMSKVQDKKDFNAINLDDIKQESEARHVARQLLGLKNLELDASSELPQVLIFASPQSLSESSVFSDKPNFWSLLLSTWHQKEYRCHFIDGRVPLSDDSLLPCRRVVRF